LPTATKSLRGFEAELSGRDGVSFELDGSVLKVKGSLGEIKRDFYSQNIKLDVINNKVYLKAIKTTKREKAMIGSIRAHIKNMERAICEGIDYKLKVCSTHFPMTVSMKDGKFIVKNFIGERHPRVLEIPKDVDVKIDGDIVDVHGIDKERVGYIASRLEMLTKRSGFDSRVFQDGIYIIQKDGNDLK
jgi:large subunit ribosomal protein L6